MKKRLLSGIVLFVFAFCLQSSISYAFLPFPMQKESSSKAEVVEEPIPAALPAVIGPKKLIAVAEFENKTNWQGQVNIGTGMADQLITALMNTGRYIVLERGSMNAVLREQDFAASGRTTATGGADIGKLSRAQVLIQGAVTEFGARESEGGGFAVQGFAFGGRSSSAEVGIDLRIYDTTTGHVLASKACRGVAKSSGSSIGYAGGDFGFGTGAETNTPMDEAVRAAIQHAVNFITFELDKVPWEGRVAMVKDGLVFINAGRENGIQVGDRFLVLREEETIVDPETGLELGAETARIGEVEVLNVQEKFSKATPLSGAGFEKNDILRLETK